MNSLSHKQTLKQRTKRLNSLLTLPCSLTSEGVTSTHKRSNATCNYAQKKFRIIDLPYRLDLLPRENRFTCHQGGETT